MNRLIYKFLIIFIGIYTLGYVPVRAQEMPAFNRISLGGDFALDLRYGKQFRVQMDVEELFSDYVLLAVEDSVLNISVDERRVPGDIRRLYRGRDAVQPVFRVSVTMPEVLSYLRLSGRSILASADDLVFDPDEFALRATDNATTASFFVRSGRVSLDMDKKSDVTMRSDSDTLFVRMAGNSNLNLERKTETTVINTVANVSLQMEGETEEMEVHMKGTSKAILNGVAGRTSFDLLNSANVNAISLDCREAWAVMNGICTLSLSVREDLYVDLNHGASLYFLDEPDVHVQYIKNSSLMPYSRK